MPDAMYCDICQDHDALTPATIAFCVHLEDDPAAPPQYVRCCKAHEGHAAVAAAFMRCHLAPAAVYRQWLHGESES